MTSSFCSSQVHQHDFKNLVLCAALSCVFCATKMNVLSYILLEPIVHNKIESFWNF